MTVLDDERGSTIPLILGCFLLAMVMVAGSIAAGDAFVQQRDLQSVCDGAAAAAASAADLNRSRSTGDVGGSALQLGDVQGAVQSYLARDPSRSEVQAQAALSSDALTVAVACTSETTIAFGAVFAHRRVVHHATSSARAPVS